MWIESEIKGVFRVAIKMKKGNSSEFFIGVKFIKKRSWAVKNGFYLFKAVQNAVN